jgi:hypothetical protein
MARLKLSQSKAGRDIERRAYDRAADLAKAHAEHWEDEETRAEKENSKYPVSEAEAERASMKAGHWRIIETEIRGLALESNAAPLRVIVTKSKTYRLALTEQGIPVEDYFAGVELP